MNIGVSTAKAARYDTDTLCTICQENTGDDIVKHPTTYDKVLSFVRDRGKYIDNNYREISRRFGKITSHELKAKGAS